jgi:hypothetical protein
MIHIASGPTSLGAPLFPPPPSSVKRSCSCSCGIKSPEACEQLSECLIVALDLTGPAAPRDDPIRSWGAGSTDVRTWLEECWDLGDLCTHP